MDACGICGSVVVKRQMKQHKQSAKCQSCIPNHEVAPREKTHCDRCGKVFSNMCKHMDTLQCYYYPALKLNIPMKLIIERQKQLPEDMNIEDNLNQLCEEFKDGYVAPVKEVKEKPFWKIKMEELKRQLDELEIVQ